MRNDTSIVQFFRSIVAGRKPNPIEMKVGEMSINFPDKRIYTKDESDVIIQIGAGNLNSLENVSNVVGTNKQVLRFDGVDSVWKGRTLSPNVTISLTGPITGNATVSLIDLESGSAILPTLVTPNSIVLTRDTTGYYVGNVSGNNGVYINHVPGEDAFPQIWIGQNVDTTSDVTFNNVDCTANINAVDARITNNVSVTSRITSGSIVGIGSGYNNQVYYTTPGSHVFNIPNGVNKFRVTVVAGAGSGGSAKSGFLAPTRIGHGGNSGAVSYRTYTRVNGQNSVSITVGSGGTITSVGQKANGGNSSVTYASSTVQSNGGLAGNHYNEAQATTPASFSGADFGIVGTIGSPGGSPSSGYPCTGAGSGCPAGFGHITPLPSDNSAQVGRSGIGYNSPGAGGSTGNQNSSRRGGNGSGGLVIIEY